MSARESDVERFLRGYGKVRDISLKRGYGFVVRRIWIVPWRFAMKSFFSFHGFFCDLLSLPSTFYLQEFDDYRDADDAIADLNGKELMGER